MASVSIAEAAANALSYLPPSGDVTGVTDTLNVQAYVNINGIANRFSPGRYYLNKLIDLPVAGGQMFGSGDNDATGSSATPGTEFFMVGSSNLNALFASTGWNENSIGTASNPWILRDIYFNPNAAGQSGGNGHGVVLQTFRSKVEGCTFAPSLGDGLRFDALSQNGLSTISNNMAENKIWRCNFRTNQGNPFHTNDTAVPKITDGYLVDCIFQNPTGLETIFIQGSAGWDVRGNHLYGPALLSHIRMGHPFETRCVENYVDTWGHSAVLGTYSAIDFGFTDAVNDSGNGSSVYGNTIRQNAAAGNVGSTIYGIASKAISAGQATIAYGLNTLDLINGQGTAAMILSNAAATSTFKYSTGSNVPNGAWTAGLSLIANGGTMTNVGI